MEAVRQEDLEDTLVDKKEPEVDNEVKPEYKIGSQANPQVEDSFGFSPVEAPKQEEVDEYGLSPNAS